MDGTQSTRQPLLAHLLELRRRLLWSVFVFGVAAGVSYVWHDTIIRLIQAPLNQPLYYTTPSGGLEFLMKVCTLAGLALAIPAFIYNLVKFIEPATTWRVTRRAASLIVVSSFGLLIAGVLFAYKIILPLSLHFFGEFSNAKIKPLISATDYLSFVLGCLLTFALIFQLPLILLFINRITPLPPKRLMRYQRHVIVGSLVIALVLPFTYDPLTQFVMAVPIIALYEISILMLWFVNRRRPLLVETSEKPPVSQEAMPPKTLALPRATVNRSPHIIDLRQPSH